MAEKTPPGVRIKVEETKERCGTCQAPFIMEVYLDPLSERRSTRVYCKICNYDVPLEEEYY
ncbi:MAG: hypothetical protein ACW98F_15675 [Candidatus Hodarchaeales archaeon]